MNKEKEKLKKELDIIIQQIEDLKLEDGLDVKKLKELIKEREHIEFKLGIGE